MKLMEKTKMYLGLIALSVMTIFSSCDNQNTDNIPIEELASTAKTSRLRFVNAKDYDTSGMDSWQAVTTTPAAIQTYVSENHMDETLLELWMTETGEYIALLDDDTVLVFNASEQFVISFNLEAYTDNFDEDFEEIDSTALPQAILDYLVANHADIAIDIAGQNTQDQEYVVVLESGLVLIFDSTGNLIEQYDEDDYEDYEDEYEEISTDSLSQVILDYLNTNYNGIAIELALFDAEEGEFIIILENGIAVIFDQNGNFIEEDDEEDDYEDHCEEVAIADLPTAITDYISANYSGIDIEEAWFDQDEKEYYIELNNDVVLIFAEDGSFIGEDTEDEEEDEEDEDGGE